VATLFNPSTFSVQYSVFNIKTKRNYPMKKFNIISLFCIIAAVTIYAVQPVQQAAALAAGSATATFTNTSSTSTLVVKDVYTLYGASISDTVKLIVPTIIGSTTNSIVCDTAAVTSNTYGFMSVDQDVYILPGKTFQINRATTSTNTTCKILVVSEVLE
jgi:hypothetical protein